MITRSQQRRINVQQGRPVNYGLDEYGEFTCIADIERENQTKLPRGKRRELNVYEDYAGFDCQYVINKSHKEGDITVIDDFTITSVSIVEGK